MGHTTMSTQLVMSVPQESEAVKPVDRMSQAELMWGLRSMDATARENLFGGSNEQSQFYPG